MLPGLLPRLSPAQARLIRASQAAMLTGERETLARLQQAAERALAEVQRAAQHMMRPHRGLLLVALRHAADGLRYAVTAIVLQGRGEARQAARGRLHAELAEVSRELRVDLGQPPANEAVEDAGLAQSAAESYVAGWRAALTVAVMRWQDGSPQKALRTAHDTQAHRLDRIAATEVPQAYSAAHDEGAGWVAERHKDARWLPLIVKRWDAKLDRACSVCSGMDGRLAPLGMSFKGGLVPAFVHPRCRCLSSILVLPVRMRGEVVPGYQVDDEREREAA